MSTKEAYQSKLETITAISEDQIQAPTNVPVKVYVQEAENLFKYCLEDKTELVNRGMSWELVMDLPIRAGALREAESIWGNERFQKEKPTEQWLQKSPAAHILRDVLLHEFRFAYRKDPELMETIKNIAPGNRHTQMIQDLNDLSRLGKNNPEPLEKINFDMTQLDRAAALVDELSSLYADTKRGRTKFGTARTIRDQAYTHLKEAVDEIRDFGRHVFWRNKERRKGYKSEHLRRRDIRQKPASAAKDAVTKSPETPPAPTELPSKPVRKTVKPHRKTLKPRKFGKLGRRTQKN